MIRHEYEIQINRPDGMTRTYGCMWSLGSAVDRALDEHSNDPDHVETIEIRRLVRDGKRLVRVEACGTMPYDF